VTEHFTSAQIANWRRQNLAPAELLGADDHLAGCVECRRLVESALDNDAMGLYAGLAEGAAVGQHLSFDQSAAYVDGLLTGAERRMIEDHLASCARCAPLTTDLRAFRNEIATELERELAGSRRGRIALAPPQNPLVDLRVGGLVAFGGGGVDGDVESNAATDRLYVSYA
jgi:predicted anti-sigma-YlaC factor YlaD